MFSFCEGYPCTKGENVVGIMLDAPDNTVNTAANMTYVTISNLQAGDAYAANLANATGGNAVGIWNNGKSPGVRMGCYFCTVSFMFILFGISIIVLDFVYFEHFLAGNGGNYINGTKSNLQNIINRIIAESSNCFAGESEMYTPSAFGSLKVLQSSYSDVTNGFSCGIFQQIILSSFIYFF